MSHILVPLPLEGFDPTETAVPWKVLSERGHKITFATPNGSQASADSIMVTGRGLGPLKYILRADANGREAYAKMLEAESFQNPISYEEAEKRDFDALVLPGGHDKRVKPYLESPIVQQIAAKFMSANKPVGAICHGVLVLARTKGPDGLSILRGRNVTSLINRLETPAYLLTRLWMGDYYRTYPGLKTEDEVRAALAAPDDFSRGPMGTKRDSMDTLQIGFVVRDENLITARWPGDSHRWSVAIHELLSNR